MKHYPASHFTGEIHDTQDQPETATESTERPTSAAEVATPEANTRGQTGTANHSGLAASDPASRKAVAKKVGQSEQEADVEAPVDTNPPSTGVIPSAGCTAPSESAADEISESVQTSSPEPIKAGALSSSLSVPAILSDEEVVPAFMKGKPGCLKLRDGHCKIGFATEALCAECADKRARAMA